MPTVSGLCQNRHDHFLPLRFLRGVAVTKVHCQTTGNAKCFRMIEDAWLLCSASLFQTLILILPDRSRSLLRRLYRPLDLVSTDPAFGCSAMMRRHHYESSVSPWNQSSAPSSP